MIIIPIQTILDTNAADHSRGLHFRRALAPGQCERCDADWEAHKAWIKERKRST